MSLFARRPYKKPRAAPAFALVLLSISVQLASAQARQISQQRTNELAAVLLRARRALIEEPGLRRDGERLETYMERIAARLPGEPDSRRLARGERYVTALERAASPGNICIAAPVLQDNSPANTRLWQKAAHASALLPQSAARVRAAWTACRQQRAGSAETQRLGRELTQAVYVIKSAYDALREARP